MITNAILPTPQRDNQTVVGYILSIIRIIVASEFVAVATSNQKEVFDRSLLQQLSEMLARLKRDFPIYSPRYVAHMLSDQTMPSVLGYFAGMLYNPNNVTPEAAPVTVEYYYRTRWGCHDEFVELFDREVRTPAGALARSAAPLSTANFLSYVDRGRYESTFFHRATDFAGDSGPARFLQGGGFSIGPNGVASVPTDAPMTVVKPGEVALELREEV